MRLLWTYNLNRPWTGDFYELFKMRNLPWSNLGRCLVKMALREEILKDICCLKFIKDLATENDLLASSWLVGFNKFAFSQVGFSMPSLIVWNAFKGCSWKIDSSLFVRAQCSFLNELLLVGRIDAGQFLLCNRTFSYPRRGIKQFAK